LSLATHRCSFAQELSFQAGRRVPLFFPALDLWHALQALSNDLRPLLIGISLASLESTMSEIASPSTYNEPTVMWRMTHQDGRWAQAVFDPLTSGARVQWFVNGHSMAVCDFADWTSAIEWSDRLRAQQWTVGWRLSDDIPDPPARSNS
jgi:hypothetical protein